MKSRKRSRQTTVLASLTACCLPIATAATTPVDPFSWSLPSATNSLQNIPRNRIDEDTSWWKDDAGGSDDGNETESSSDDDEFQNTINGPLFDGPVAFETTSISYSTVPGSTANSSSKRKHPEINSKAQEKTDESDNVKSASYQSMKTLDRLQQMLDDTDYITKPRPNPPAQNASHRSSPAPGTSIPSPPSTTKTKHRKDSLWTSKDRSKYKKQQRKMMDQAYNGFQEQIRHQRFHEPVRKAQTSSNHNIPPPPASTTRRPSPRANQLISDDELSEDSEDALGYTLPNLPVYFSDAEGDSETEVDTAWVPPESNRHGDTYPLFTSTSYIPDEAMERQYHLDSLSHPGYSSNSYQQQQHAQQSQPTHHGAQTYAPQNYQHTYPPQYFGSETLPNQVYGGSGVGISPPSYPGTVYMHHGNQPHRSPPQWTPPVIGNDQTRQALQSPQTPNAHFRYPQSSMTQASDTATFPLVAPDTTETENLTTVAVSMT